MSLLQDNLRALVISQRPSEHKSPQAGKQAPFVSRVFNRDPIGLPPIKNNLVVTIDKKPQPTYVEFRNRQIIKQIQNLKKQEKEFLKEEENNQKKKIEKYREFTVKNNNNINDMRKELYGENYNQVNDNRNLRSSGNNQKSKINSEKEENINMIEDNRESQKAYSVNNLKEENNEKDSVINREIQDIVSDYNKIFDKNEKENIEEGSNSGNEKPIQKSHQLDISDLPDEENLVKFMENLDYDKYVKNLEVREALYLLKNKVEKEKGKEDNMNENNQEIIQENNQQEEIKEKITEEIQQTNLPPIEPKNLIIHDKDWNERKEDSEILKKKIADKILKIDKNLKTVHSFQSIKRLLEREGFDIPTKNTTLKISVVKDRDGINNFVYKPSLLPNLREIPHL